MIFSSMIYIPIFSLFTVPFNSLANELTPDYEERTSIMTYRIYVKFKYPNFTKMMKGINLFAVGGHKDDTIGHAPRH